MAVMNLPPLATPRTPQSATPGVPDPGRAPGSLYMQAPQIGPMGAVPGFTPPIVGTAPAATPYGSFTAPDINQLNSDPSYQYDLAQQLKAVQRGAAAKGTLLTGGLQKRLGQEASGVASQHYGDIFNRALQGYTTNRDTNQQNFGQALGSFNATTGAALDAGRLGLAASQDTYGRARDAYGDLKEDTLRRSNVANVNAENEHNDQLLEYARQAALQRERASQPQAQAMPTVGGFQPQSPLLSRRSLGVR